MIKISLFCGLGIYCLIFSPCFVFAESDEESVQKLVALKKLIKVMHFEESARSQLSKAYESAEKYIDSNVRFRFKFTGDPQFKSLSESERNEKISSAVRYILNNFKMKVYELDFVHEAEMNMTMVLDKDLSLGELNSIIAFYETPTGQKSLNASGMQADIASQISSRITPRGQEIVQRLMNERKALLDKRIKELDQSLKSLKGAGSSSNASKGKGK